MSMAKALNLEKPLSNKILLKISTFHFLKLVSLILSLARIPRYSGHVPNNFRNLKGNLRPRCFSTAGETFI